MEIVYKVFTPTEWREAGKGIFAGSEADIRDGFIHLSTAAQVEKTVERHYPGAGELVLAAVRADVLGEALRWETSRGAMLFPHLYGHLRTADILWAKTFDARTPGDLRRLLPE